MWKRRWDGDLMHSEDYGDDRSDSCDSDDENHREIDYPEDEEAGSDEDCGLGGGSYWDKACGGEDEEDEEDHYTLGGMMYAGNNDDDDDDEDGRAVMSQWVSCAVCCTTLPAYRYRLDEWDHYPGSTPSPDTAWLQPCQRHYVCIACLKKALLSNPLALLREGQGHVPCLGDSACSNELGQRTTTYLYQVRDLFSDEEWATLRTAAERLRTVCGATTLDYHPFAWPLTTTSQLTSLQCYQQLVYLLEQDHPRVRCPICLVTIQKTTACFALRHCDWEMCWMCGQVARRLDIEHWKTCPRYDSHPGWAQHGYVCLEGQCYTEDVSCTQASHAPGREAMDTLRRSYQVRAFWTSLPLDLQTSVKAQLSATQRMAVDQLLTSASRLTPVERVGQ